MGNCFKLFGLFFVCPSLGLRAEMHLDRLVEKELSKQNIPNVNQKSTKSELEDTILIRYYMSL